MSNRYCPLLLLKIVEFEMKKLIVASFALSSSIAVAAPPPQQSWQLIGDRKPDSNYYVDVVTAVRAGDVVIYWSKSEGLNGRGQILAVYMRTAVNCSNLAWASLDSYASLDGKPSVIRTFKNADMEGMFFIRKDQEEYVSTIGARYVCDGVKEKTPL